MKTQALVLIALLCSSAFAQITGSSNILTFGTLASGTNFQVQSGQISDQCALQRGGGVPPTDPSPFIYTIGADTNDCDALFLAEVGSYVWAIFLVDADTQLIDARTSYSGTATATEYPTRRETVIADTVFALRVGVSNSQADFGKIHAGYQINTKDAAGDWQGIAAVTAANSCRHHLVLTVDTTAGTNYLTDETGARTEVSGTGVYLGINTRTGEWTAYPSTADPCDAIEAIVEEQEEEEKSAGILSIAALAALGVVAI